MIIRPSRVERFRYFMHRSASSRCSIVTNPKPRDSRVRGSSTKRHSNTFPSREKCSWRSFSFTRVDKPVTYRLFPGLFISGSLRLRRGGVRDLERSGPSLIGPDLPRRGGVRDREGSGFSLSLGEGELEYLLLWRGGASGC